MNSLVCKLITLKKILLDNNQNMAAQKVIDVMNNIDDKDRLFSLIVSLDVRDFGDLYLPFYDGNWWHVLSETRKELEELYYTLKSKEQDLEEKYIDMLNELYNIVKQIDDKKLLLRLETIVNEYNSSEQIRDMIKICELQGGRPIEIDSIKYGNWRELISELMYNAKAYLKKMEIKKYSEIQEEIDKIKKELQEVI